MKSVFLKLLFGAIPVVCLTACSNNDEPIENDEPNTPRIDIQLSRSEQTIVNAQSEFAFDFMKAVNDETPENVNTLISPLSMAIDLSLLANGTSSDTYKNILEILHLDQSASINEINNLNCRLVKELVSADSKVKLSLANSIWTEELFNIKDSFIDLVKNNYNAPTTSAKLNDPTTFALIDKWGNEATNGMVPNASAPLASSPNARFLLLNALYFDGKWSSKFLSSNTTNRTFYNNGVSTVKVPTMEGSAEKAAKFDDMTVVQLPYGNSAYSMYILLPEDINGVDKLLSNLTLEKWNATKEALYTKVCTIYLPKFKYSFNPNLNDVFRNLGLELSDPDISAMSNDSVEYLNIFQQSSIEVEENGTKAATVSSVVGGDTALMVESVEINRPFIFIIEEQSTCSIIFTGKVTNIPTK